MLTEDEMNISPYSLSNIEKTAFLNTLLRYLTKHHYENCPEYRKILDALSFDVNNINDYRDIPFLPVRLFKNYELKSVPKEDIVKTLTSSGTTGQQVSKIFLDKQTSSAQSKILTKIVPSFLGKQRVPMIILDSSAVIKDRSMFSARGAGILGFSIFGTDRYIYYYVR